MRALVTGGAGFVGTNLVKRLLADGHYVVCIDNFSTGTVSNKISGIEYHSIHMGSRHNHPEYLRYLVEDIDIVFHLAAKARIQPSFNQPEAYLEANYKGTYDVVRFCTDTDIPLVYAGSSSCHSGKFKNPYTFSKVMGEDIIRLYQEHFGLKSSTARFYNVYGPHQLTEGGYTTLIGKWLNNIKKGNACDIFGDGEKRRDFTHVDDIVDALIRIMNQQAYGHVFELGRGENHSINEVAKMFDIVPWYQPDKPGEAQDTLADSSLAQNILGWEAKLNLIDYIREQL